MKVTVDAIVFAYINKELNVLLIKRAFEPFLNQWALPGGFIDDNEDAETAVVRKLKEETNINLVFLEQLYTFTDVKRDPRERIISISYYALINPANHVLQPNIHATEVKWLPIKELMGTEMAFDHQPITRYALMRLRNKIKYEPIGFELLPKQFTMSDLFDLYVAILGDHLDRRNFIKKIVGYRLLKPTKNTTSGHVGRRARLFEFNKSKYGDLKLTGFNFDI